MPVQPVVCPPGLASRRDEFAAAVDEAEAILADFARMYGWSRFLEPPFFDRVEIHATQDDLWQRIRQLEQLADDRPLPTTGLAAGLVARTLVAVTPEEYARIRPEYAAMPSAWARLLAHELAHALHIRLVEGDEDAMGPKWFFEGFATLAAGQVPPDERAIDRVATALELSADDSRGAYARYARTLQALAERVPLPTLVERAGSDDFEAWLRSLDA